jgi:hypothetical protein
VDSFFTSRTHRVLSFRAYLHTFSTPFWRSIFPQNAQQSWVSSVQPMHSLDALLAELLRILSDSGLPQTLNGVLLQRSPCVCSMPTWQSSYRILSGSVCNCVSATQPCLLRCSATSKVFPGVVGFSPVPQHVSV